MGEEFRTVVVRQMPPWVMDRVEKRFRGQPERGRSSPEQGWWRTNMCIDGLDPEWVGPVHDLWESAQVIGASRFGSGNVRLVPELYGRLARERLEFDWALQEYRQGTLPFVRLVGRLSSVLYRSVQAYGQDHDILALETSVQSSCALVPIPPVAALRCAVQKMWHRAIRAARGEVADKEGEEQVMRLELEQFSLISGITLPSS